MSAKEADLFVQILVKLHGILKSIVSNGDKEYVSHFWKKLFCLSCTQLKMSSTYYPQTNKQSKVLTHCLE